MAPELAVRAALGERVATRALANVPLVPVPGGLSNHAWRADAGNCSYFVRLGGANAASLGVDRESECVLLEAAAEAGLSPRVHACDPRNGLMVADYVQGSPWQRTDAHEPLNVARIGAVLRKLHSMPLRAGVRGISFDRQASRLEGQLAVAGSLDPELRRIARPAFASLASRGSCVVLCHNDLHHLNILDDGERLWLVDWEYGGCGDPLFDLASFLCQHESTPAEREMLLEAYGDSPLVPALLVPAACVAFDYVQWLWYRCWVDGHLDGSGEYAARADAIARRILATRI